MASTHEHNRQVWERQAAAWGQSAEERGTWRRCATEPGLVLDPRELAWLSELQGRRVAVLGSGDNEVVFALAGLGARVTSVDIAAQQLRIAAARAEQLGLQVEFVRADVLDLGALQPDSYDLVYTGGHLAVWVSDLPAFHTGAVGLLRPGGLLLVSEYHPFRRVFGEAGEGLRVGPRYFDRGPHEYRADCDPALTQYEYNWTVADYVMAVQRAGCELLLVDEFGEEREDWEPADLRGLPRVLLIVGRKQERPA